MHIVITNPVSGEIEFQREMTEDETFDLDACAEEWAQHCGLELDESAGYVPNCSGDFRVEYRPDVNNSVHIWDGQSYYFKAE
jgi:hypothetical protein